MKSRKKYLTGDALTKIGCGIFGGLVVALFIGSINKNLYYFYGFIAMILIIIGYYLIIKSEYLT